jgi:PKD repeat protein
LRRLIPLIAAIVSLAAPAAASAATINLTETGFNPTQVVIPAGDSVTFNNTSLTQNVKFEDEASARCAAPLPADCARAFPAGGQFRFRDANHLGCDTTYEACDPAYKGVVVVDGPPTVTGLGGPATGLRGQAVTFSGTAADPNGDTITNWIWDFGDGQSQATADGSVNHAYAGAGHFNVALTVQDSRGNFSAPQQIAIDIGVPDSDGDGFDDDHDACSAIAGTGPDGCPPPPPIIVPPQIHAGTAAAETLSLAGARRSGIPVVVGCSDKCTAALTLSQIPGVPIATATVTLPGAGTQLVTLRIPASTKASALTLEAAVTDAHGRTRTLQSRVELKSVSGAKLPAIGISDQQAATFSDPLFQVLRLKYARLVTPWNSIFTEPGRLGDWLEAARAHDVRPLVSFMHARGDRCPKKPCRAPNVRQFRKAWLAFHHNYPWVKDISPWNEVNSATQPTGKRPDLAAAYHNVVRASCRGCTIVAADVLDAPNLRRYLSSFLAKAKGKPRLWGLHNYSDTNRFRQTGTRALLRAVKGTVWFTETGGVVKFTTQGGKKALPQSESRAKKAMDYMFRLAKLDAKRVKRIYVYQWKVNDKGDRFDAGVVRPDGSPRPSFHVLTLNASMARSR